MRTPKFWLSLTGVVVGLVSTLAILTLPGCQQYLPWKAANFPTPYQAVLLDNGNVYFGKLEGFGRSYPVLTDVYYLQRRVNAETKEATTTLIKRGSEWHAPDRMILDAQHIVLIEPVTPESQVAKLIAEEKKQ